MKLEIPISLLLVAANAPIWLANSYATYKLWNWFLAPNGLPSLSYIDACGIVLMIGLFSKPNDSKFDLYEALGIFFGLLTRPFVYMAIGKILLLFV